MTLTEYLFALRPEDCEPGTRVEAVYDSGRVVTVTFGERVAADTDGLLTISHDGLYLLTG